MGYGYRRVKYKKQSNYKFSHLAITLVDFNDNRNNLLKNVLKNKENTKSELELNRAV